MRSAAERAGTSRFLFVGGHPGVDFLNTRPVRGDRPVELLASFSDLVEWLNAAGLLESRDAVRARRRWAKTAEGEEIVVWARQLREALRETAEEIIHGRGISGVGPRAIDRVLAANPGALRIEMVKGRPGLRFRPRPGRAVSLLALAAEAAADLFSRPGVQLLRRCENPECVLYFLDTTRNRGRRWCSMAACGNRMKVSAFRRRQRKREGRGAETLPGGRGELRPKPRSGAHPRHRRQ